MTVSKLIIYTPVITSRHNYIFNLFFNEILKINFEITKSIEFYKELNGPKINYSNQRILDEEIHIESNGLLEQKTIYEQEINIEYINNIPVFFLSNNKDDFRFDLFACSFYLVSRYEEYLPYLKDEFERYPATESLAYKFNFLKKPIINYWAQDLSDLIINKYPETKILKNEFKYISTLDIDNAYLYKGKGFVRSSFALLKHLFLLDFKNLKFAFNVIFGLEKDPYDTYDLQIKLQNQYKIDVRYFVLLGDYGLNDKNISHNNSYLRSLIKFLSDKFLVGIHSSYASAIEYHKLSEEIKRLEHIQKRETLFIRQHFLKILLPKSYRNFTSLGLLNDFSMGYSSELGFRASIATPFYFYDLDAEQVLPIKICPFCISDNALRNYSNNNIDVALEVSKKLIDEVVNVNGILITLWHNDTYSDFGKWKGWSNLHEDLIKYINKK